MTYEKIADNTWKRSDGAILKGRDGQSLKNLLAELEEVQPIAIADYQSQPRRVGEFREFMRLFTQAEKELIIGATLQDVNIKIWYDTAMGGAEFSLDHPQTEYGLSALVAAGLLTQYRKDEILAADFNA